MSSDASELEIPRLQTEVQVMFFDTDCAAVVHNIAYLRFIETNRTLLAEQLGMNLQEMALERVFPVVVRTEIDYRRAAVLGDKLAVNGRLDTVERSRFWCAFEVRRTSDDMLLVQSRQMLALLDMKQNRPIPLPEVWTTRFAHLRPQRNGGK